MKKQKWFCVATEGATVDGREITGQWIAEMAESYSIEEYTALIWAEHARRPDTPSQWKNWGTVDALKAETTKDGVLKLFAKITPNNYLIAANKDGQKLFTSIEPNPNFRGTGKCYLMGLAVTDSPASTGTTRLKFSMGANEVEREFSDLELLDYEEMNLDEAFLTLSERYEQQSKEFKKLSEKMDQLQATFDSLLEEAPGQRPSEAGAGSYEPMRY